jgi:hypothetical protein
VIWLLLVAGFPLAGALLYRLIRPAETQAERRARRYRRMYLESLLPAASEAQLRAETRAIPETDNRESAPAPGPALARLAESAAA